MKRTDAHPTSTGSKKNTKKGLENLIKKLNIIGFEVKQQKLSSKTLEKSLKKISEQMISVSSTRPKFTEEAQFISGKNKLFQSSKQNQEKKSLENLMNLIDEKNENQLNMITEEVLKRRSIKKAFKAKKREFGFKKVKTQNDINDFDTYADLIDLQRSKILSNIMYSNQSKHSQKEQFSRGVDRSRTLKPFIPAVFASSLSPGISRVGSPVGQEKLDLMKDYHKTLHVEERENDIAKFRLSRLLSLRKVFHFDFN